MEGDVVEIAELGTESLFHYSLPFFITQLPLLVTYDQVLESTSNDVTRTVAM
jgi:hypothetical protein